MALTTVTQTASGRLPSGSLTTSTNFYINSGVLALIPYKTSAVCNKLSCMGAGSARGAIAIPAGADYFSTIKVNAASTMKFVGVQYLQNEDGTHKNPKGGGSF